MYDKDLCEFTSLSHIVQLAGRTIRVDHVEEYKVPKMTEDMMPEQQQLALEGCAPQAVAPSASPDTKEDPPPKDGTLVF